MSLIFILTIVFIFLTILVESIFLLIQLKNRGLTKWFGNKAFTIHAITTGTFWSFTFLLIIIFQFQEHLIFYNNLFFKITGIFLFIIGVILALWSLKLISLKGALCINFFENNVTIKKNSLYKYLKNPMDIGFFLSLTGFVLFTGSVHNLIITTEFILLMIPHIFLENRPLKN